LHRTRPSHDAARPDVSSSSWSRSAPSPNSEALQWGPAGGSPWTASTRSPRPRRPGGPRSGPRRFGGVEGSVLGGLQALVLRRLYPALPVLRWIALVAVLGVVGWATGSTIPIVGRFEDAGGALFDPPVGQTLLLAGLFGAFLARGLAASRAAGIVIGAVAGLAFRRLLPRCPGGRDRRRSCRVPRERGPGHRGGLGWTSCCPRAVTRCSASTCAWKAIRRSDRPTKPTLPTEQLPALLAIAPALARDGRSDGKFDLPDVAWNRGIVCGTGRPLGIGDVDGPPDRHASLGPLSHRRRRSARPSARSEGASGPISACRLVVAAFRPPASDGDVRRADAARPGIGPPVKSTAAGPVSGCGRSEETR
jgi:hypothetical protein